jgi:addiction module HigA family antidote
MLPEISKIKGIHPGAILRRELKNRGMKSNELAELVNEYKQTISAILNERRSINPGLSIKLAEQLDVAEDYFMHLQASYDVKRELEQHLSEKRTPNLKKIRKILFWDTDFDQLDWERQKSAIIKRVFERGNDIEIREIISFYGPSTVNKTIHLAKNDFLPTFNQNVRKYLTKDNVKIEYTL